MVVRSAAGGCSRWQQRQQHGWARRLTGMWGARLLQLAGGLLPPVLRQWMRGRGRARLLLAPPACGRCCRAAAPQSAWPCWQPLHLKGLPSQLLCAWQAGAPLLPQRLRFAFPVGCPVVRRQAQEQQLQLGAAPWPGQRQAVLWRLVREQLLPLAQLLLMALPLDLLLLPQRISDPQGLVVGQAGRLARCTRAPGQLSTG